MAVQIALRTQCCRADPRLTLTTLRDVKIAVVALWVVCGRDVEIAIVARWINAIVCGCDVVKFVTLRRCLIWDLSVNPMKLELTNSYNALVV